MRFVADLRQLLEGVPFRRLFGVRIVSQASDGIFQEALASYVLFSPENKPNASAIAAGLAALLLPFSVLGPFVGVFLDRWRRRQVLLYANLTRIAPVAVLAVMIGAGVRGAGLFVVVLLALSANRFLLAGLSAALPHVVRPRDLVLANSVTPTSGTIAFVVGLAIASGLRPFLPSQADVVILLVAGLGYLAAAWVARSIPVDSLGPDFDPQRPQVREALARVVRGLRAGLSHLRDRPVPSTALGVIAVHRFFFGLTTVVTVLLYRNYFNAPHDTDAALAGLATAVLLSGVGFFVAAVVTPLATQRITPQRWIVVLLLAAAVIEVMPGLLFAQWGVLVAAFALGVSAQGVKICVDTLVQTGVDDAFRGRVFALYDVVFNVVFVAAAAVGAAVIPDSGKSAAVLVVVSAGYAATALAYSTLYPRLSVTT